MDVQIGQWADRYSWSSIPELCDHDYPRDCGGVFRDNKGRLRCSWCRTPVTEEEKESS